MDGRDQERFDRLCGGAGSFMLTTHINPDGDGLGSQIALAEYLRARGKRVTIVNHDPAPESLGFLFDDPAEIEIYDPAVHDRLAREVDLICLLDNSAPDRLGDMEPLLLAVSEKTLCIDHHPSRQAPWRHQILETGACATTAMVYDLVRHDGWRLSPRAAEGVYVGLVTDTGFFRFNSTNARAHRVAAELLESGVQPARAYGEIYERNSLALTRLLGTALTRAELRSSGRLAVTSLSRSKIAELGAEGEDTSEITTPLLALDGVLVVLLFRELPDGKIKVSLRSKGALDVHRLASEFGGGGHRNASGIVLECPLAEAETQVIRRAEALLDS